MKKVQDIRHVRTSPRERKIDDIVESQAFDENAWEEDVEPSTKSKPTSIRLSPRTIQRAKFFAKIHGQRGYQSWLKRIIEERIGTEYSLYQQLKKRADRSRG